MAATVPGKFRQAVEDGGLIAPGDRVLAAVSGGGDSVALLRLLVDHAARVPHTIVVAHVNHRLRGAAADEDQRFVESLAARLALRCVVLAPEEGDEARRVGRGEEGAREVRHALLARAARAGGCRRIALGHTMDDQAETVLMRLARGAGRRGLSGMAREGPGRLIRPMLGIRRDEARAWLDSIGQDFREDETNLQPRMLRNKVRGRLLPLLADLNPSIVRTLARNAQIMAEEDAFLDLLAGEWVTSHAAGAAPDGAGVAVPAGDLAALPVVLARRAARLILRRAGADPRGAPLAAIDQLLGIAGGSRPEAWIRLPGGMQAARSGLVLQVRRGDAPAAAAGPTTAFSMVLEIPGRLDLPGDGGALTARLAPRAGLGALPEGPRRAALDADQLGAPARVRTRLPGDTFHPLGARGGRKLKEFLIDCKVPRPARDRIPLVVGPAGIAWAVGLRIGHVYRVTPATRAVALLEYEGGWI